MTENWSLNLVHLNLSSVGGDLKSDLMTVHGRNLSQPTPFLPSFLPSVSSYTWHRLASAIG